MDRHSAPRRLIVQDLSTATAPCKCPEQQALASCRVCFLKHEDSLAFSLPFLVKQENVV
jgi:hypothetical protein